MSKINIFVTLGPSSLNKKFLTFIQNKASLVRLNMSHIKIHKLEKRIVFIKKNCNVPICIDTEGAQIRTNLKKNIPKKIKLGSKIKVEKKGGSLNFYPPEVFHSLKKGDILDIGFEGLQLKILKKIQNYMILNCTVSGVLENNKGVHLKNRKIKLNFLTKKDYTAIEIAKRHKIKNFALSFTNSRNDIDKFCELLPKENKIFKIETVKALKSLEYFFKKEKNFLIDRGDLSKEVGIENIPKIQREIFKKSKKFKKIKIAIATNFLETMIKNPYPTRAEANDIFSSLEMGANSLVLAGETAMGQHPIDCVKFLIKLIRIFKKSKN